MWFLRQKIVRNFQDFLPNHWGFSWKSCLNLDRAKQFFAVRIGKDINIAGNLKIVASFIFFDLNCVANLSDKRCNLKDEKGSKVSYNLYLTGPKSYVEVLKQDYKKQLNYNYGIPGYFLVTSWEVWIMTSFCPRGLTKSVWFTKSLNWRGLNYRCFFIRVC